LMKASGAVLMADKELLIFPILSTIGSIIVMLTFIIPMFFAGVIDSMIGKDGIEFFAYIVGFMFYVVLYTVTFFANSALVGAAMIRLDGGDPTIGDGIRIATKNFFSILGWALLSATVGMVLQIIAERAGTIGKIIRSILGLAWSVATYLVVPILVVEGVGPIEAVKQSTALLKKTWGEQIAGSYGIGGIIALIGFGFLIISIPLFMLAGAANSPELVIVVAVFLMMSFALLGIIGSALKGIYTAAVYRYAKHGDGGQFFDVDLVQNAFRT